MRQVKSQEVLSAFKWLASVNGANHSHISTQELCCTGYQALDLRNIVVKDRDFWSLAQSCAWRIYQGRRHKDHFVLKTFEPFNYQLDTVHQRFSNRRHSGSFAHAKKHVRWSAPLAISELQPILGNTRQSGAGHTLTSMGHTLLAGLAVVSCALSYHVHQYGSLMLAKLFG